MEDETPRARDPDTGAILEAAVRVHRNLGPGFLEAVYQSAMALEMRRLGIRHEREVRLPVIYDGALLEDVWYRVDFIANGVLVELKAASSLTPVDEAQVLNYLRVWGGGRGLLVNFGAGKLDIRRFVV